MTVPPWQVGTVKRSPLSEILAANKSKCLEGKPNGERFVARILTSAESIALLEEKKTECARGKETKKT